VAPAGAAQPAWCQHCRLAVNQEDLLPPEKAFAVSVERQPDHLLLH
jgi:hypothetical protein